MTDKTIVFIERFHWSRFVNIILSLCFICFLFYGSIIFAIAVIIYVIILNATIIRDRRQVIKNHTKKYYRIINYNESSYKSTLLCDNQIDIPNSEIIIIMNNELFNITLIFYKNKIYYGNEYKIEDENKLKNDLSQIIQTFRRYI